MIGQVDEVVVDCSAPAQLATFWAGILGGQPVERSAEWAFVDPPGWTRLAFQRVPESKLTKNRLHIDVSVDDVVAATEAAERSAQLGSVLSSRTRPAPFRCCWIPRETSGASSEVPEGDLRSRYGFASPTVVGLTAGRAEDRWYEHDRAGGDLVPGDVGAAMLRQ